MSIASILKQNKPVIQFITLFFGSYLLLTLVYKGYLYYLPTVDYYPDFITYQVAKQSYLIIDFMGYNTSFTKHPDLPNMHIGLNEVNVVRVIEGCNGMSVIILFCSFIIGFNRGLIKTILFLFTGICSIYILNVVRIALLTIGLYYFPQHKDLMHDILFPLVIYGTVFLLWIYWVNQYKKEFTS